MPAQSPQSTLARHPIWMDLALVAFLVGFVVVARLLPHAPGFVPVAASALFAGRVLRYPALAVIVPVAAMALSNLWLPIEDWRITTVGALAISVAAFAGMLTRRWNGPLPVVAAVLTCSLIFFAASNFAVWAFSGMYPLTAAGLVQCYIAALPFLEKTVMGDLFWTGVLFGGAWLIQNGPALARRAS